MLKRRSKALLKANAKGAAKWEREKLVQRLGVYNKENDLTLFKNDQLDAKALFPTQKFFQDNKTELFELRPRFEIGFRINRKHDYLALTGSNDQESMAPVTLPVDWTRSAN